MNQGEHITVVAAQQLAQLRAALGMADLRIANRSTCRKSFGNLLIQLHTVCDNYERPVTWNLAQHFLRKEHHRKTLAGTLSLPEHTAAPVTFLARLQHGTDGVVHADELVVLSEDFGQPALVFRKQCEIFHQVEQARRLAQATQHHL